MPTKPALLIYECGRMQVNAIPYDQKTRLETWVDWPAGTVSGYLYASNGMQLLQFTLKSQGTNVFVEVDTGTPDRTDFVIETTPSGGSRLRQVGKTH